MCHNANLIASRLNNAEITKPHNVYRISVVVISPQTPNVLYIISKLCTAIKWEIYVRKLHWQTIWNCTVCECKTKVRNHKLDNHERGQSGVSSDSRATRIQLDCHVGFVLFDQLDSNQKRELFYFASKIGLPISFVTYCCLKSRI